MRNKKRATKTFFSAWLRNFPLRVDRKLISHAIDMGPFQTFDLSWHFDHSCAFVNDVFWSIFTILSIDMLMKNIMGFILYT